MANDAYRALVGPDRPLVGRPVREALPELAGQGFFELLDQVYRSGETYVGEAQPIALARGTDGRPETRYISFVYAPVRAADGSIDGVITEGHDLTALKLAESALRQARDIDLIGRLAAGVAHDFNNLLTVILGNSELLAQSLAADDALQELAQTTYTAAERGADLTRRLLASAARDLAPRRPPRTREARFAAPSITLDITAAAGISGLGRPSSSNTPCSTCASYARRHRRWPYRHRRECGTRPRPDDEAVPGATSA